MRQFWFILLFGISFQISAKSLASECTNIVQPLRVTSIASFAFIKPYGAFDGRALTDELSKKIPKYRFVFFAERNIIVLVDNSGGGHSLMEDALIKFLRTGPPPYPFQIVGGTRFDEYFGEIIKPSHDLGSAIALHFDLLKDLQVEVWERVRGERRLAGYQTYSWSLQDDLIVGTPLQIVQ